MRQLQHYCEYCVEGSYEGKPTCPSVAPDGKYLCTRPEGHEGEHRGCGVYQDSHPIEVWPND